MQLLNLDGMRNMLKLLLFQRRVLETILCTSIISDKIICI